MKRILLTLFALVAITITSFGQVPEGFKYQAVIRDASNVILNDQAVGIRLAIHQGTIDGPEVYMETFATSSNAFGLVNLEIGTGTSTDDFSLIDWKNGPYHIETAIDVSGGSSYSVMGSSQLMSVPYALHSKTAGNVFSGDYNDLSNQPVIPSTTSDMINDSGFITNADDADADPVNEIQDLELVGNILTITNNGTATSIDLSAYLDNTDTQLSESEVDDYVSDNGFITNADDADADPVNEIQDLQITGNNLSITNNGAATTVDLSIYLDDTNTQLTESEVDAFVADNGFMDNTDEQTISIVNDTLYIENGNGVFLGGSGPVEVITDTDEDTKIQVEENVDEDVIRFDIAGTEKWRMTGSTIESINTGNSVFIGEGAGVNDDLSTNNNVFIGTEAGNSNNIGRDNVAIGYQAQYSSIGNSWENTAVGNQALFSNTTQGNTAIGNKAMFANTTGYQNVAVGANALSKNTTATQNTALGTDALYFNTIGYNNTATGANSLLFNTTGFQNTANGSSALQKNTTGRYNGAFGVRSLFNNTTGNHNVASGSWSMESNTSGVENSAYGNYCLGLNSVGQKNTAIGVFALYSNTTGNNNVGIGNHAGSVNSTGSDNVFIGFDTRSAIDGLSNATAIGNRAIVSASNKVQIGNNQVTDVQLGTGSNVTLETGLVKITGGDPGVGKILTSDVNGNATWQTDGDADATNELQNLEQVLTVGNDVNGNSIVNTGQIAIGTALPNSESSMHIATALPVIFPVMTQAEVDGIVSPVSGMIQYNQTEQKLQVYTEGAASTVHGNSTTSGGGTCLTSGELTYTPPVNGFITDIALNKSGAGEVASIVVKSDNACNTNTIIGQSNSVTCVVGWNTWTFATPVPVTAGVTYYITSDDATGCLGVSWSSGADDPNTGSYDSSFCFPDSFEPASKITLSTSQSGWVDLH